MKRKIFYGWINLIVLWFCYMFTMAAITYGYGVIVEDMRVGLGLSLTIASGAYTGYSLIQALLSPLLGAAANRFGAKKCLIAGGFAMALGCGMMAFLVKGVLLYYVAWMLFLSFGVRFASTTACQLNIAKWFFRRRGLAMAIYMTSGGVGGYILTPLFTRITQQYSWRGVWALMAAFGLATAILSLLIVKEDPNDIGQQLDGGEGQEKEKKKGGAALRIPAALALKKTTDSWTLKEARGQSVFYCMVYFQFLISFYMISITSLGISHFKALGFDAATAALIIGSYSLANLFGRLLVGFVNDHIDTKYILFASGCLMAAGLILMMFAQNEIMAYSFAWLAGIGYGMLIVTPPNALANYFGSAHYAGILSMVGLISGLICCFNPLIMGSLTDLTGSSMIVWYISLAFVAVGIVISLVMKAPKKI